MAVTVYVSGGGARRTSGDGNTIVVSGPAPGGAVPCIKTPKGAGG